MKQAINQRQTRRLLTLLAACHFSLITAFAQVGSWRAYISYCEPQEIVKAGDMLFVRASNGLYSYNLNDHSISTFDKVRQLNDSYVTHIGWNAKVGRLMAVYQNSNIDLIDVGGNVVNLSALYSKSMTQDKTVNHIYMSDQFAYLGTGFGVVKVNMQRAEVTESYILNHNTIAIAIENAQMYIKVRDSYRFVDYSTPGSSLAPGTVVSEVITEYSRDNTPLKKTVVIEAVYKAPMSSNLLDQHNWEYTETRPAGNFSEDLTDWNNYIDEVRTLQPGGPKYNYFGFMRFKHNRLYTCGGGYSPNMELNRPGSIQILNRDGEWQIMPDNLQSITGVVYVDVDNVDAAPDDPDHIFAGSRCGLYEFRDGQFAAVYNTDNSPLQTATTSNVNAYTMVEGLCFDDKTGSLWVLNSSTRNLGNIFELTKDYEWISHEKSLLTNNNKSLKGMQFPVFDSRGYLWFVNNNWEKPCFFCYDPKTDNIVNSFFSMVNQDGTTYNDYTPYCVAEDLDGNVWIGTNQGPFIVDADRITTPDTYVTQVKVPRNDGTNYADYLMSGAVTNCIVVDGGGRKWMGTKGSGVYLISADNMTQLQHFTSENSPLLSNNIESMVMNNETGELFIGTEDGLCSYMTDATSAAVEMVKDNVYAYPNPVVRGYDGLITVVGLSLNADVKILSASGQLVAQGRSNGGTFTWNGRDRNGRRVASGVYMVAAATSEGNKGTVCKIAIIN
ncbi:MAG: T9SS type A sorting domain-containing protein [Prevotella sp.]|nr:T9SS type A sorting domain-containing protein [Prevotella sp.]